MKHETPGKLKFKLLQKALGLPSWQVIGLLQSLWIFTAGNTPRGNIGRFSDEQICSGIDYDGDAKKLIEILVKTGWLDRSKIHRLIVHHWKEHCEEWVKKRIFRSKASGGGWAEDDGHTAKIQTIENSIATEELQDSGGHCPDSGGQRQPTYPNPNPNPNPNPEPSARGRAKVGTDSKEKNYAPGAIHMLPEGDFKS